MNRLLFVVVMLFVVFVAVVGADDSADWSCTFLPFIGGYLDQGFVNEDLPGGSVVPVVPDALCVDVRIIVPTATVIATAVPTVTATVIATAVPTVTATVVATAVPTVIPTVHVTRCYVDDGECDDD